MNGVLLGLAGGLAGSYVGADRICRDGLVCIARLLPASLGAGAAIGWGVDAVMQATLYSRVDHVRVSVVPQGGDGAVVAKVAVSW